MMIVRAGMVPQGLWLRWRSNVNYRNLMRSSSFINIAGLPTINEGILNDSLVSVAINLLERGAPTLCSTYVERELERRHTWYRCMVDETRGSISWQIENNSIPGGEEEFDRLAMFGLLPDQDSSWHTSPAALDALGSEYESLFLQKLMNSIPSWLLPFIELQPTIKSILGIAASEDKDEFVDQRADFYIPTPWLWPLAKGIVLEVDGSQHREVGNRELDARRDDALVRNGNQVIRFSTSDIESTEKWDRLLSVLLDSSLIYEGKTTKKKKTNPKALEEVRHWIELPRTCAAIQRALLEAVCFGILDLKNEKWRLAFSESHLENAEIACNDLVTTMEFLFCLEGQGRKMPSIEVVPSSSNSIPDLAIELDLDASPWLYGNPIAGTSTDHPVLIVTGYRSGTAISRVRFARPIEWASLVGFEDRINALENLLADIFRKVHFREGQIAIIDRVFGRKSAIGLMPTGSGKSLTYQLPALLQPGITLVVDPLKSLMQDQVDGLDKNAIDRADSISSYKKQKERQVTEQMLSSGSLHFCLVSPERFQIKEFRTWLEHMRDSGIYMTHLIIDEVHCVSEWGHDFRPAYLRIGNVGRQVCSTFEDLPLPIIGLTATASYDVLSDIQRELGLSEGDIATATTSERKELTYQVIQIPFNDKSFKNDVTRRKDLAMQKREKIAAMVTAEEIAAELSGQPRVGVIFTPWTKSDFGAEDLKQFLERKEIKSRLATYHGQSSDMDIPLKENPMLRIQQDFVNGNIDLLCATKAFGIP